MALTPFRRQRMACSYFFIAPSLVYGFFTSRLPALKAHMGASEADVGSILLCLGAATVLGLAVCGLIIERLGSRLITIFSVLWIGGAIACAMLAQSVLFMSLLCFAAGLGVGLCDVAMNAQGIFIEQKYKLPCLSFLHAISSLGGVCGALLGSLSAWLGWTPFLAFCVGFGIYLIFWPIARANLESPSRAKRQTLKSWKNLGFAVWMCGIISLLIHVVEGSVGEWGSLLLNGIKGAPQREAALAFAFFTAAMVVSRLAGDRLRMKFGDFPLLFFGALLGALGMAIALLSPWVWICLAGYALMGGGLGPIAPILFSRAGTSPNITPGQASAAVSFLSYAGLLVLPPLFGFLSHSWGLLTVLWTIPFICAACALGALPLRKIGDKSGIV